MNITIRKATNKDIPTIRELVFSVLKEYNLQPDPIGIDSDLDNIQQTYFANNGYFGVIEVNGKIIATIGIYKISDSDCELRKMYCTAEFRGKGIGKMLLEHGFNVAKELGYTRMTLETATPLKEAIALYKKYGFNKYTPKHNVKKSTSRCDQSYELSL
jgi:putative acetyltransferase